LESIKEKHLVLNNTSKEKKCLIKSIHLPFFWVSFYIKKKVDSMDKNFTDNLSLPVMVILILLALSFLVLMPVLNMVLLGAIFAYGLRPVAKGIQSKLKFNSISIIIAIFLVLIPLILLLAYIIIVISGFAFNFFNANHNALSGLTSTQLSPMVAQILPAQYHSSINSITTSLYSFLTNLLKYIVTYFISLVKKIPYISLELCVLFFSMYYFTKDGDKFWEYVKIFIPEKRSEFFDNVFFQIKNVLKSIFFGHFLTAIIIGIIAGIGFFLLGYPYALFLGIAIGVFQLIPIFGPWPIYTVLFLWDLFTGNYIRAIIVLFFGFFLSLSDMYIRPALSSKYADIHPLILFIGFISGPLVFGIVGFILGPLFLGITYAVIKSYKIELEKEKIENNELTGHTNIQEDE
jgi:predicted PurR-regulated permease PerM